jgi:hypothetical protein
MLGSTIRKIVTGHRGDDNMAKAKPECGLGNPRWLIKFNGLGITFGNRAKTARAGALVSQNHERRCPAGVAFGPIGTLGIFTNSFESEFRKQVIREKVGISGG